MCFWQFGIAGRRINSSSFCLFFSCVVIFEIVELHSVDFVFPSMFSSSEPQATKKSISPSHGVVRMSEKVYLVRRKQRVKGRGKKEKKDDVTSHQRKGSLPSPLTPSHSPFAFYSPSCKTVLLLRMPRRLSVPPALPCKASQGKKTFFLAKVTLSLCDSRATGLPPKSSRTSLVASPSELAESKMKPKINFLFAEQTFGSHMFVCTLTMPGQNLDADLSENRTGFGLQNLPND